MKNYLAILFFTLGFYGVSQAQIKLNHVAVGVSYWERSYDDATEKAFFTGYRPEDGFTKGGVMPHLGAELNLYAGLALDARVGFWNGKFENRSQFGDLIIDEKVKQTLIPLSAGLVYNFDGLLREDFSFFAGAGINRYFIENKVERVITGGQGVGADATFSGNNYGAYAKAGVAYTFARNFSAALEARYNSGYYNQSFQPAQGEAKMAEQVSVRGIEGGLSLRYHFGNPSATGAAQQNAN